MCVYHRLCKKKKKRLVFYIPLQYGLINLLPHIQGEAAEIITIKLWQRLQLPVEKPWSMPGGPFVCFLAQTGVENAPFTL